MTPRLGAALIPVNNRRSFAPCNQMNACVGLPDGRSGDTKNAVRLNLAERMPRAGPSPVCRTAAIVVSGAASVDLPRKGRSLDLVTVEIVDEGAEVSRLRR